MKNLLYISFLLFCISTNAQTNFVTKIPEVDSLFLSKLTGEFFFENKQSIGDQYFNTDWNESDILLSNGEIVSGKLLKYNGLFDELIWLNTLNFGIFKLDKSYINEFWLRNVNGNDIHFKRISVNDTSKLAQKQIFVEVKFEGRVSLYIQRKIAAQWPEYVIVNDVRKKYDVLKPRPIYYINIASNQFLTISKLRRTDFLRLFPEKKKEISKIIRDNHLNIKLENDFVRLIELINKEMIF